MATVPRAKWRCKQLKNSSQICALSLFCFRFVQGRGDGSGRAFRRAQYRFAYQSLLKKIHSLARKRGVEVLEVNPQDTSTIGMLKYAPQRGSLGS